MFQGKIMLFSDGAAKGNPGPGGWGSIICWPEGKVLELGGSENNATNNQMELKGAIEGLSNLGGSSAEVHIFTDSTYVINGINGWIYGWMARGWTTMDGKPVANRELWQELHELTGKRKKISKIFWHYLRGHAGIPGNERVDDIAQGFAAGKEVDLFKGALKDYGVSIMTLPSTFEVPEKGDFHQKNSKPKKAYSYLSLIDGKIEIHPDWKVCEARVKGRPYAKFKKAMSKEEEAAIVAEWSRDSVP
ncbi:MAG: ribonuclease HI [Oligoflexales bacterium]|nr:ribonuclease HI [Oligoflexales bacterium]